MTVSMLLGSIVGFMIFVSIIVAIVLIVLLITGTIGRKPNSQNNTAYEQSKYYRMNNLDDGKKAEVQNEIDKLKQIRELVDLGILSEDEFSHKKKEILK